MIENKAIWEIVKAIESKQSDKDKELSNSRAIMILNYGTEGKCIKKLCEETDTLSVMLIKVLSYYQDKLTDKSGVKPLGTPTTIGELKLLINGYDDDVSFGFRNQPLQTLYELELDAIGEVAIVFQ